MRERERERESLSKYLHTRRRTEEGAMRAMAYTLLSSLKSHPLITAISVLLLSVLPIFKMLVFFWPLIVSTVLGVLAVVSFGRQSDEHLPTPTMACRTSQSSWQPDIVALPSHEEKVSNVLMVGDQEVTWLEWLHNEDMRKVCTHEQEPPAWDADGCYGSVMPIEFKDAAPSSMSTVDASICRITPLDHTSHLQVEDDKARPCMRGLHGDSKLPVSTLVLTEENVARDEANIEATADNYVCRSGIMKQNGVALAGDGGDTTHVCVYTEGSKDWMSAEGLPLVNEGKTRKSSTIHTEDKVTGCASAEGGDVVGISEGTSNCDVIAKPLASAGDVKSMSNTCLPEGESSLPLAISKLEKSRVCVHEFASTAEAKLSDTSGLKIAHVHEEDVLDLPEVGAEVHNMRHVDEQDKEERGSGQLDAHGLQWDASDGEEDRSSLRFSFFHNSSLTSS